MNFLDQVTKWGLKEKNVISILLVGSYAKNSPKPDSDVDIVIIVDNQNEYITNYKWIENFGKIKDFQFETWGKVKSIRVFYSNDLEVEFGIAEKEWCRIPVDPGTFNVVNDGCRILLDKGGILKELVAEVNNLE